MRALVLTLAAVLFAATATAAQSSSSISGTVYDYRQHRAVQGARVTLESPSARMFATTDRKGWFSFFDVPPGDVRITIAAPRYYAAAFTRGVRSGASQHIAVPMFLGALNDAAAATQYYQTLNSVPNAPDPNVTSDLYTVGGC